MPSFDAVEPLGPDACRSYPSAPCYYIHLKRRALNGGRDELSASELAFVGIPPRPPDGWRQPALASVDENDAEGQEFDAAVMQAMSALGMSQERLEFLG